MSSNQTEGTLLEQIFTYYPLSLVVVGTILNLLTFLVFCRPLFLSRPTFHYLRAISLFDIMMLYGWNLDHYFNGRKELPFISRSLSTCKFFSFLNYFAAQVSAWLRVFICIDRYLALYNLSLYKRKINFHKTALIIICLILTTIFLLNSHILILSCYTYTSNSTNMTIVSIFSRYYRLYPMWDYVNLAIYNCIPFILMSGFNSGIIYYLIQIKRSSLVQSKLQYIQITISLVISTLLFSLMTVPGTAVYAFFLSMISNKSYRAGLLYLLDSILYTYHITSFILYFIALREFREELVCMIKCNFKVATIGDKYKTPTVKRTTEM
ncbi:unnamed protein product [Didymodactylos carnosus]|uniref:G-protein coupled receptors family 1 profile domain-containing protein n=1 Tax=Didymodactylos carnosus TaxID=1234261 RepID=A0A813ZJA7_9BILA|nr:unnamed protein product [Didymodactylos carnosus]CAF0900079.1 unnamed protein product [Didymodactylos carnosus]CAF3595605.1 unnamed protein product [Didymodactylos carnosus]CAF3682706.1 unnamed protein product [Didymodactylos carnosus]